MSPKRTNLAGWLGGYLAVAILALCTSGQGEGATVPKDETGFAAPTARNSRFLFVTSVVPADNALNVPVSTNVTVTFSDEVDPGTVTDDSFRLLDPDLSPVPAQVSVSLTTLQATLDPVSALGPGRLYTVEVTDDVLDTIGEPILPFDSQFETTTEPPQQELPDTSDQATPPPNATRAKTGSAVSGAGNLNGDGIAFESEGVTDFLAGAPGLEVAGEVEAGGVAVYLGSATGSERVQPDIVFRGESAHDRAGVAVAGNFDFNGDGNPDILIGAEQVNRTASDDPVAGCNAGAPCGNGKVYLIYFDPTDLVHYPNIGNPAVTDSVSLSLVGVTIPGVVFTGTSLGDQVGFAVAGGGRLNTGIGQDVAIGAPGSDPGSPPRNDAGAVYVIFDDPSLSGTIALDRVANGQGDEIDGVVYRGAAADDHLGFSVSFPGDVMGTVGDDIAMGAPGVDAVTVPAPFSPADVLPGAGAIHVHQGGGVINGIIESSDIGTGTPGSTTHGDQADMQLGYAVAGGGDNLADGEQDLLMGAPTYDARNALGILVVDAGLVAQTASKLQHGILEVSQIGADPLSEPDAVAGVLYTGTSAGDMLGSDVASLEDVTGDGFEDIAFGAPARDPVVGRATVVDAGTAYRVDGRVPADLYLGSIDVDAVGNSVAGTQLVGTEEGEHAGASLAGAGDFDGDLVPEFLVGAPFRDFAATGDDAGTVYIVLESEPTLPGTCGPEGCVVVDLETGAQISVPPGSLSGPVDLAVDGIVDLVELPIPPPPSMTLLGAADYDPEALDFSTPFPTIHVPIRPGLERQFTGGETVNLWYFYDGTWIYTGTDGTVEPNPHYEGLGAVGTIVNLLHLYAVFIADADGDGVWDLIDSYPLDPYACMDSDGDTCDDCSSGTFDPADDGTDTDGDTQCDVGDADDDNDGVPDPSDVNPLDPGACADADGDGCDDCTVGTDGFGPLPDNDPDNDGPDNDFDGLCDLGDPDDDNDGVPDVADSDPLDPSVCADVDDDLCDDCAIGTDGFGPLPDNDPANDGPDTDFDGLCDIGDVDDDNDGVPDAADYDPLDPGVCADVDGDTCDDCAIGTDGFGPLPDNDPANDGIDTDFDGLCDAGDPDDDGDGVADELDCAPLMFDLWAIPGEAEHLVMEHQQGTGVTFMYWTTPSQPGTILPLLYDTIRTKTPFDFVTVAECLETDGTDTTSTDANTPPPGGVTYSLVRAENGCGGGSAGEDSFGLPRVVISCP